MNSYRPSLLHMYQTKGILDTYPVLEPQAVDRTFQSPDSFSKSFPLALILRMECISGPLRRPSVRPDQRQHRTEYCARRVFLQCCNLRSVVYLDLEIVFGGLLLVI